MSTEQLKHLLKMFVFGFPIDLRMEDTVTNGPVWGVVASTMDEID